ncbi:MAG: CpaF family protein [Gammaproteobacteria bacterium]
MKFGNQLGVNLADELHNFKGKLHRFLLDQIDNLPATGQDEQLRQFVREKTNQFIHEQHIAINQREIEKLVKDLIDELTGYGPIDPLLRDDKINDILVNGPRTVYIERNGRLELTDLKFIDNHHLLRVIRRILAPLGRRVDESSPMVDTRLPDGSRVNAIVPPLAIDGPCLSIRKFRKEPLTSADLLVYKTLDEETLALLRHAVQGRCNLLVAGSTGAGKTTLLNVLSSFIPPAERLITIEDAAELNLRHPHVVRLETRPPTLEGTGAITARELVRNALRMRPDRIILGEIRGTEVLDMLQAMNTGHDGSMATIHANSPRDALNRLELLAGFAGYNGSELTLRQQIASSIDLIVHIGRMQDGRRRVLSVEEIISVADNHYATQTLYRHDSPTRLKPKTEKLARREEELTYASRSYA